MSEINPETGEVVASRSPRFNMWTAFLVFSIVTFGASMEVKGAIDPITSDAKWAVACSAITFAVTTVMVALQMHPVYGAMVTNNKFEGAICVILVAFWSAIVSIVSDASNNLAVRHVTNGECNNTVLNGNLYYFSWAAFVTSICLLVSYLRSAFGVDLVGEVKNRSQRLELWSGLLACSLVVMGSSTNVFVIDCKPVQDGLDVYCTRCKFGISIGVIGTVFSLMVVGMKLITQTAPFVFEGVLGLVIAILNGTGVAFITSAEGPGSAIGNLYYFTWLSFLVSISIVSSCYSDMFGGGPPPESTEEKEANGDIQIEQLPADHENNL